MNMNIYLYDPETSNHLFITENIKYELKKHNINNVYITKDIIINENEINIYIIFVNLYFLTSNEKIKEDFKKLYTQKYKILYITEPLNFDIEKKLYKNVIKNIKPNLIYTYSKGNYQNLKIPYLPLQRFYPISRDYLFFTDLDIYHLKSRSTDKAIFLCKLNDYRTNVIQQNNMEDKIEIIDNCWLKEDWIDVIKENLFYLNIHRRKGCKCLELMRIIPILYNGGVIVSSLVNEEEMNEFKAYNIYFCHEEEINNKLTELKNNINYEEIINKAKLFRSKKNEDIQLLINYINKIRDIKL